MGSKCFNAPGGKMFQYPQTKIRPRRQNVSILLYCIIFRSMQEEDWGIIYVGSMISWWSLWDEEIDSSSIHSFVEISPSHQEFDLHLKSPNVSLKARLLKIMLVITWSKLDKKLWRYLGIVMEIGRLEVHIIYCNLTKNRPC